MSYALAGRHSDADDEERINDIASIGAPDTDSCLVSFIRYTAFLWIQLLILLISYIIMAKTYGIEAILVTSSLAVFVAFLLIFYLTISLIYALFKCLHFLSCRYGRLMISYKSFIYHSLCIWYCSQIALLFLICTILIVSYHPYWKGPFEEIFIQNDDITLRPYFQTTQYSAKIYEPQTVQQIQDIINNYGLEQNRTIRVVGSAHSSAPLFTNDILVSLNHFQQIESNTNRTSIIVGAGAILKDVEDYLYDIGYVLPGFGSVQEQTMAGMIGTSVYGIYGSINQYVLNVWMVDGNGNDFTLTADNNASWIAALKTNIGLLGVIYQIEFEIEKTFNVYHETHSMSMDALQSLTPTEFEHLFFPQMNDSDVLGVRMRMYPFGHTFSTYYNTTEQANIIDYERNEELRTFTNSFLHISSCLLLECEGCIEFETDLTLTESSDIYSAKSSLMSDAIFHGGFLYALPFEHCQNVLIELIPMLDGWMFSSANIIPMRQNDDYGLLSYAVNGDVCMIEIYPPICSEHRLELAQDFEENILLKYNGTVHWSKQLITINDRNMDDINTMNYNFYDDNINLFNDIRNIADPNGIFMNDYLKRLFGVDDVNDISYPLIDDYRRYSAAWEVVGWYSIGVSFVIGFIISIWILFSGGYNEYLLLLQNDNKNKFWFTFFGIVIIEAIVAFIIHPIVVATVDL